MATKKGSSRSGRHQGTRGKRKELSLVGRLVYFGGAVHEVLPSGKTRVRRDLAPGSPKRLWKPKWSKPARSRKA